MTDLKLTLTTFEDEWQTLEVEGDCIDGFTENHQLSAKDVLTLLKECSIIDLEVEIKESEENIYENEL